ncbi:WD40-repeat-containing domain protein [Radiomyces spectabilis]|uniref:WD40-repeat-containing domain protein n=1 Tax=Radiomyces spectabilis TaxID=64574 RepID=UPI00221E4115|nr:WD40-repeat-containing domain protein [Radiomyces spectabilis]KAI8388010.1 WD40-repeat-containing domain protein [Radiomyces spectabilis]
MSVHNHRAMMPAPPSNRVIEMLDAIRAEFDQMAQEAYICKSQRDDFEMKINSQIQEMNTFQKSLVEMERSQQTIKKQYEEEIARLRQQIKQTQARAAGPHAVQSITTPHGSHPPPPNIGPGSNYFGGIMSAHGKNQAGLVAPPQMSESVPQQPPTVPPPPPTQGRSTYPPSSSAYSNASNSPAPPPASSMQGSYGSMAASASPYPPQQGYGYPVAGGGPPPSAQSSSQVNAGAKRKSRPSPTGPPPPPPVSSMNSGRFSVKVPVSASAPGGLADIDPESVPPNMKIEGQDWFALYNPKTTRYLKVDLQHTLEHGSVVCCVKFSADGRYLAAGCNRSTFIYDVATAQRICVLQDDKVPKDGDLYIRSVCFSPDGQFLATGAEDKLIRIWDIAQKRVRNVLAGHEQDIYSLDFSRDGKIIVSGSGDRTARIWAMDTGKCLHVLRIKDLDQKDPGVTSVAVSPDGRLVAAGSLDKMVRVWDSRTGAMLERLEGHKDSVYSVAFMPDGKSLVSGSLDKTLKLWQLGTSEGRGYGVDWDRSKGPCKMTFTGHKDFVLSVATTPDGHWIVSGSKDRGVQFWDPRTGQTQFMLQGHKNSVISVAISPAGRPLFATGSGDNRARIWSYEPVGP